MRTETRYICEICNSWYRHPDDAASCEEDGVPEPLPVGLIDAGDPGDFYDDKLAFAVAKSHVEGHEVRAYYWACRDGIGDSLGEETCGSPNTCRLSGFAEFKPEWHDRPPMIRLLKFLRSRNIHPLVRIGDAVVPMPTRTASAFAERELAQTGASK